MPTLLKSGGDCQRNNGQANKNQILLGSSTEGKISDCLCAGRSSLRIHIRGIWFRQGELALTIMGIDGEITPHVMAKLGALSVRVDRCLFLAVFSARNNALMCSVFFVTCVCRMLGDIRNVTDPKYLLTVASLCHFVLSAARRMWIPYACRPTRKSTIE